MIEERAVVERVADGHVWVDADRTKGCATCEAGQGCGGGVLGKLIGKRASRLPVLTRVSDLAPGDVVIVGIDESALVRGSLVAYLLPLFAMFASAAFAEYLLNAADLVVALFAALGLVAGFAGAARFSTRVADNAKYQPVILRKDVSDEPQGCRVRAEAG